MSFLTTLGLQPSSLSIPPPLPSTCSSLSEKNRALGGLDLSFSGATEMKP